MTDVGGQVRLGTMLFTLVEPHRGHEVAYNRWYERDHFYAGCMVGPNFQQPKATVSETWLETDPRVSAESTTYREWWKAFDDPVLDHLVERAYEDNLSLRSAAVRVLQARAQLGIEVDLPARNGAQRARESLDAGVSIEDIYRDAVAETKRTYTADVGARR